MSFVEQAKLRLVSVLRWSETYTKTDMVYLTSGGFWSILGQLSAAVIALCLAIAMARFVPKDTYGSYKYVLAVVAIIGTFSLSGIGTAVFQSAARGFRSAIDDGFRANLRWSVLVFFGAAAGGAYYLYHGNTTMGFGILLGGCITPFLFGFNLYLSLLMGEKDFRAAAWYGDFVTNIVPAIILILIAYFAPQPLFLIAAYFVANTAAAAYAFYRAKHQYPDVEKKHDPGMLTYGKHLSAMNILTGIAGNIDQVLLFHFVGPVELAIYNFATAIPDQAKGPLKMLDQMIQVQFAKRQSGDIRVSMMNKILWLLLFNVAALGLYVLLAPVVYRVFFPNYSDAIFYSQLYAISYLGTALTPASSYLSAKKKVRELYLGNSFSAILQIIAMFIGVVYWGLLGLVVAKIFLRIAGPGINYALYSSSSRTPDAI